MIQHVLLALLALLDEHDGHVVGSQGVVQVLFLRCHQRIWCAQCRRLGLSGGMLIYRSCSLGLLEVGGCIPVLKVVRQCCKHPDVVVSSVRLVLQKLLGRFLQLGCHLAGYLPAAE